MPAVTAITLDILVQPRASREKIGPMHDGRLKIAVTAPPVDGEANAAVIALVARRLGVARSAVEVVAGASARRKTLQIAGVTARQLEALIAGPGDARGKAPGGSRPDGRPDDRPEDPRGDQSRARGEAASEDQPAPSDERGQGRRP